MQSSSASATTSGGITVGGDTISPSMPANLAASAVSSSQIDLSWSSSTDNVGVTGYKVYRNGIQIVTSTHTSYSDTGRTASTSYSYTVAAYDAAGNTSSQSSSVNATTQSSGAPITAPIVSLSTSSTTVATGESFTLTAQGTSSVGLAWVWWFGQSTGITDATVTNIYPPSPTAATFFSTGFINPVKLDRAFASPLFSAAQNVLNYSFDSQITIQQAGVYTFGANSRDVLYPVPGEAHQASEGAGIAYVTITVIQPPPPIIDIIPSVISNVRTEGITESGAKIRWTTDEPSDSKVSWGTVRGGILPNVSEFRCDAGGNVKSHCVKLTGLTAATIYYYKAVAKDSSGNERISSEFSFISTSLNATIQGTVTDSFGRQVASVGVHVYKEDFSSNYGTVTSLDGTFVLVIPPGTYLLEISPPFARTDLIRPSPITFSILQSETKTLNPQFAGALKTLSGTVRFSDAAPITDAEVGVYSSESGQWVRTVVGADGKYTLRVGGGIWKVNIRPLDTAVAKWTWFEPPTEVVFIQDNQSETKVVNFVVPVLDATIAVFTVDEDGIAISGAGIVLDTISGDASSRTGYTPSEFRRTDTNGRATFTVKAGTYYVRAYLSKDRGYLNPAEQAATLASGATTQIRLVFGKPSAITSVQLSGNTRLEDGTPTDAFIWAWSEKGRFIESRSQTNGAFTLQVSNNDRWHIGAGKEINSFPYKSSEFTLDVRNTPVLVELILSKIGKVPLPPLVTSSQEATQEIVVQTSDGARTTVPARAAGSVGTVTVEMRATVEAPSQAAAKVVSTVYDVTIKDAAGAEVKELTEEIEIILPYDENNLAAQGVNEDNIVPSFYDETIGVWVKVDNYTIDKEKNIAIVRVKHLTRFALVGAADITPPSAPTKVTAVAVGDGEIKLTWEDPITDFNHAKVYRSTEEGELGKISAVEVLTNSFVDEDDIIDGTSYYYTIRAVDSAGNESNNVDQISVLAVGTSAPLPFTTALPPGQAVKLQILRNLTVGSTGDDVTTLQQFLLDEGVYPEGLITGYFGSLTKQAVTRFQEKYAAEILTPLNLSKGTGFFGPSTLKKVNELLGVPSEERSSFPPGQAIKGEILRNLTVGSTGDDVTTLQQFLLDEGVYPEGLITGYFGSLTKQAVTRFQEKYAAEILTPLNLSKGTGFFGPSTLKKVNGLQEGKE